MLIKRLGTERLMKIIKSKFVQGETHATLKLERGNCHVGATRDSLPVTKTALGEKLPDLFGVVLASL